MGLSTLFSNLSIIIVVALLVVSVAMFFYFRQKISELERASLNQAKVLQSFISRMFTMPPPPNYNQLPPSENKNEQSSFELTQTNKKEKIQVSDDEDEDEEYSSDESDGSDDDDSSSRSSDTTLEDRDEDNLKLVKLQELNDFDVETLERQNVKKISLQHLVDDNIDLQPLELKDSSSLDGSCDESLSELSDDDDDDESVHDEDHSLPSKINVVKQQMNEQELKVEQIKSEEPPQTNLSAVLNKLSSEHVDIQVDVSNIDIVKKVNTHNTSLKDKSNELSNLKVDTLRQLVVDKSLASSDEAKKLKKKDLLVILEEKPAI